jgi:Photosynthesis system II assembly factor YCF48
MAAEEDKEFDAVLGGFLANNLRDRAERLHCPEPEVLAAYHERSLLPEEMNSWKEHIVGCSHCQAILGALEATDAIPLQASQKEEALVASAVPAQPAATAGGKDLLATPVAIAEKPRVIRLARGVRWQWLAPAGALAAGLLVWVVWHENQQTHLLPVTETKVAQLENPATPKPEPSMTPQVPEASTADQVSSLSAKDQDAIAGIARSKKVLPPGALKHMEKYDDLSRPAAAPARPSNDKESGARQDAARDFFVAGNAAQNQPAPASKAGIVGAAPESARLQSQAANVQGQDQLNAQKVPGPSPFGQAGQTAKSKSEASPHAYRATTPAPAAPEPSAAFSEVSASPAVIAGSIGPHLIFVPGTKTLWRVGHAGLIEFSTDGGASWLRQTSNVLVDLISGFAPSDKICWIVGRAGTILLTTDAGAHWAIVRSPLEEDLGGVRAVDALHATIWNSANTKIFETTDGGITWQPVPAQ